MSSSRTGGFAFGAEDLVPLDTIGEEDPYLVTEEDVKVARSEVKSAKARTSSLAAAAEKDMAELGSLLGKLKTSTATGSERARYESLHAKIGDRIKEAEASKHAMSTAEKKYYETSTRYKEKDLMLALKEKEVRSVIRAVCAAERVDLAFLLDCTSSMSPHIAAVKRSIKDIVQQILRTNGNLKIRLAMVGYRDFCDGKDRLQVLDFVSSVNEFERFVDKLSAKGGGDTPEDMAGAVKKALDLSWDNPTRVAFLIADAPCHGTEFHSCSDDYPKGSPGADIKSTLKKLVALRDVDGTMTVHFGKINDETDTMIRRFHGDGIDMKVVSMSDPSTLVGAVTRGVRTSIFKTMSATDGKLRSMSFSPVRSKLTKKSRGSRVLRRSDIDVSLKPYSILDRVPSKSEWKRQRAVPVKVFRNQPIQDIADLQEPIQVGMMKVSGKSGRSRRRTDTTNQTTMWVRRAASPFAEGEIRLAYHAQLSHSMRDLDSKESAMVMKSFKHVGAGLNDREQYLKQMEVSNIAYFLSKMYNSSKYRPPHCARIHFLEVAVVEEEAEANEHSGNRRFCAEAPLPTGGSDFTKFCNNTGYWDNDHLDESLLRFSKFTFTVTGYYLMVTDLQGVLEDGEYFLTDPAILCQDNLRFGHTNLGQSFMRKNIDAIRALMEDNGWH